MSVSRRSFVTTIGGGAAGLLASPIIDWRGHEALLAFQGTQGSPGVAERRADRLLASQPGMIRIDSNENPNGPGTRVREAILNHLVDANRYPTKAEDDLIAVIAKFHGIAPENIILGCGSGELLRAAVQAFTSTTRGLVSPEPTFEAPAQLREVHQPSRRRRQRSIPSCVSIWRDGRRGARHGAGLLLQSEQPDGDGPRQERRHGVRRAGQPRFARDDDPDRRGVPRVRRRSVIRHGDSARVGESARRRHADVLEGVRHGRHARRLRDRAAGHAQEHVGVAAWLERQSTRAGRGHDDCRRHGAHRRRAEEESRSARIHAEVLRERGLHGARGRSELHDGRHPARRESVQARVREAQSRDRSRHSRRCRRTRACPSAR